jgi:deoxyadenosine/deoxycytidine kinase
MALIIVEGNISAGKSTLCTNLGEFLNFKVFFEPVTNNPYLSLFYKEPKKYAMKMQLWLLR